MAEYAPPTDDYRFLLTRVFPFEAQMDVIGKGEVDADLAVSILEEAGKFCSEVIAPLNRSGDEEGATLANGKVTMPDGWGEAYEQFVAGGWPALMGDEKYGGQELPFALQFAVDEMLSGATVAFGLFPGLSRGAIEALEASASDALKDEWLPPLTSGEFTGAMALTESHAGTDLALLRTKADDNGDGTYAVTGTKIFISSGDHDMAENVVHLVLARMADAPEGVKGISLFLVPKFTRDPEGNYTVRNAMHAGSLEEKMGMHAQPTCVMNYDGATGWLVGEPHRGLAAMFVMMNAERIMVGIQGLGLAHGAYVAAAAYAKDRLQGRAAGHDDTAPIIAHADVRRMLLDARSFIEGARALSVFTALELDASRGDPDADRRAIAEARVAVLTPIVKAAFTDMGLDATVAAQQVLGGHGYVREWGLEQFVRDIRVTQIYEGTNGIQAMDLAGRKLSMGGGEPMRELIALMESETRDADLPDGHPIGDATLNAIDAVRRAMDALSGADVDTVGSGATAFLELFAIAAMGWMWTRMAAAAHAGSGDAADGAKLDLARFFAYRRLPRADSLVAEITAGSQPVMALAVEQF